MARQLRSIYKKAQGLNATWQSESSAELDPSRYSHEDRPDDNLFIQQGPTTGREEHDTAYSKQGQFSTTNTELEIQA